MVKRLFFTLLLVSLLIPCFAQTQTDSARNHPIVDTASKHQLNDSVAMQPASDSLIKRSSTDGVVKPKQADSVVKPSSADSSVVKYKTSDNAHLPAKNAPKQPVENTAPQHSTVKTINDTRYNAYLKGNDLDEMSLAGDLNHFPSPDKVLKYKKQLDLSPIQIGQLTKLADALHRKKLEMGTNIVRNEKMLDSLFHSRQIDEGSLIFYTNRSGLYYGELKGAILMACYNTEKLLTPPQIKKLETLEKGN
jgi:hypothetical protein